ncbi:unnamed protein product [Lactuca saligna]|uniref:Uncharacterized protein n=1 Tax=Lactuca saligna TaxID=75948 RepID=A0AA36EAS0_LACSI|nr:unnamed protein product [Lactuca saligna]
MVIPSSTTPPTVKDANATQSFLQQLLPNQVAGTQTKTTTTKSGGRHATGGLPNTIDNTDDRGTWDVLPNVTDKPNDKRNNSGYPNSNAGPKNEKLNSTFPTSIRNKHYSTPQNLTVSATCP